ncbi:MAG: hypothetical protein SOT14_05865, partial [Succinivibrio sp.]|nr:hypothetical protein [Succinivibrio sp.]
MENVIEKLKNKMLYNINNMTTKKLCERINAYAVATRYCAENRKVCDILDVCHSTVKVVRLDPNYFGSETAYIVINNPLDNAFKELFIQGLLSGWESLTYDEKMDY